MELVALFIHSLGLNFLLDYAIVHMNHKQNLMILHISTLIRIKFIEQLFTISAGFFSRHLLRLSLVRCIWI